jgi:hypothetical protein
VNDSDDLDSGLKPVLETWVSLLTKKERGPFAAPALFSLSIEGQFTPRLWGPAEVGAGPVS